MRIQITANCARYNLGLFLQRQAVERNEETGIYERPNVTTHRSRHKTFRKEQIHEKADRFVSN